MTRTEELVSDVRGQCERASSPSGVTGRHLGDETVSYRMLLDHVGAC